MLLQFVEHTKPDLYTAQMGGQPGQTARLTDRSLWSLKVLVVKLADQTAESLERVDSLFATVAAAEIEPTEQYLEELREAQRRVLGE
jgi:hypothetical protein